MKKTTRLLEYLKAIMFFKSINSLNEMDLNGKKCFISIEGDGKTYKLLQKIANIFNKNYSKGLTFIIVSNTIEESEDKFISFKTLLKKKYPSVNHSTTNIVCLESAQHLCRKLIKKYTGSEYIFNQLKNMGKGKLQFHTISLYKNRFKKLKETKTHEESVDYDYKWDDNDLRRSVGQIRKRFDKAYKSKVNYDHLNWISLDGSSPDIEGLTAFLEDLSIESTFLKNSDMYQLCKKNWDKIEKFFNKEKHIPFLIHRYELQKIKLKIQENRNYEKYLMRKHLKDTPENPTSKYLNQIVFVQAEKFKSMLSCRDISEERMKYIIDHFHPVYDEVPITRYNTTPLNKLGLLKAALMKHPSERTPEEYEVTRSIPIKEQEKIRKRSKQKNGDASITCEIDIDFFTNENDLFLPPTPLFRYSKSERVNETMFAFKNITVLTTEKTPAILLSVCGFELYECNSETEKYINTNVQVRGILDKKYDTRKKNNERLKKIIEHIKKEDPFSYHIGKKELGCDSTFEAIKGSNKLYRDKNIKRLYTWLNPSHPNEIADYYISANEHHKNNSGDLFSSLAVQKKIDDINQALGRVLGPRSERRRELGLDDVEVLINFSAFDEITKEALSNVRYIGSEITYNKDPVIKEAGFD